jgi:hypothetical protein
MYVHSTAPLFYLTRCTSLQWYVRTVDGVPVEYQPNPKILDVALGISIAAALVANLALISRFLERRVYASTILAIAALTVHDIVSHHGVGFLVFSSMLTWGLAGSRSTSLLSRPLVLYIDSTMDLLVSLE